MEENNQVVKDNVALFKSIVAEVEDKHETNRDTVTAIYAECCKDKRMFWISANKSSGFGGGSSKPQSDKPASDKQLKLLVEGGVQVPEGCTMSQASGLLKAMWNK